MTQWATYCNIHYRAWTNTKLDLQNCYTVPFVKEVYPSQVDIGKNLWITNINACLNIRNTFRSKLKWHQQTLNPTQFYRCFLIVLLFSPLTVLTLSQLLARLIFFCDFRSRRAVVYKSDVFVSANYIIQCKVLLFSLSYLTD